MRAAAEALNSRRRAPGRQARPDRRPAHLGADAHPSSPRPLRRSRRRRRPRRRAMGRLQAELPAVRPRPVEDLPPAVPRRPASRIRVAANSASSANLRRSPNPPLSPSACARFARARSSSTPSRRSAGRSACWPISPATRIGPPSPIPGWSTSTTTRWRSATRTIAAAGEARHAARRARVHPPLSAARPARRLSPHPSLRFSRQGRPGRESRARA